MDLVRIRYIKEWIAQLPSGNITYKTIHGKKYPYYQWTENGKQHGRRVKDAELQELSEKIAQRKELQRRLKEANAAAETTAVFKEDSFFSAVKRGQELLDFAVPVKSLKSASASPSFMRMFTATARTESLFSTVFAEQGKQP